MHPTNPSAPIIIVHRNACAAGMSISTPNVILKPGVRIHPNVVDPFPLYSQSPKDPNFEVEEQIRKMKLPLKIRLYLHCPGTSGYVPDMQPVVPEADLFRGCVFDIGTFAGKPDTWGRSIHSWSLADEMLAQKPLQILRIGRLVQAVILHNEIEFTCDLTPYANKLFIFTE